MFTPDYAGNMAEEAATTAATTVLTVAFEDVERDPYPNSLGAHAHEESRHEVHDQRAAEHEAAEPPGESSPGGLRPKWFAS